MTDIKNYFRENKLVQNYAWILVLTVFFLWLVNYFNISYPLTVTSRSASGELAVVGEGKVDITPNNASVDLGIVTNEAKSVDDAQNQINKVNNAIVENLTQLGIDKKDIKTSNYSIMPNYDYSKGGAGTITGYNGNTTVTVKVKDTSKLPDVIAAATRGGANQVMGTNYSVESPEKYREQARNKAIANAKEQAQKLAGELGIRLGKVTNIVESTNDNGPYPLMYKAEAVSMGGGNAPSPDLQPGTQTISSSVTLYFEKR